MSRRVGIAVTVAAAFALTTGCTLVRIEQGRRLTAQHARAVAIGDTKARVLERLGAPVSMFPVPGGSFFAYSFRVTESEALDLGAFQASVSFFTSERRTDRLYVRFDRDGMVTEIGFPLGLGSPVR